MEKKKTKKTKVAIQPEVNIGVVGHVDHGKTSVVKALTGEWADRHSEEIKRGITIRLGYADANFYKCEECNTFGVDEICAKGHKATFLRRASFVDCPGHETLMAVTLSGTSLMDGAMLIVAANEECPCPQTEEHMMALNVAGIKNIVIVQNKIDLVSKEQALKNYDQIKEFTKGTVAENAPIIPTAAHYNLNIGEVVKAIEENIKTPKRDPEKDSKMFIVRSFDINKPGQEIIKLKGGVVGGSLVRGELNIGDKIEIRPGIESKGKYEPVLTEIVSLSTSGGRIEKARPGGLIGVGTLIDPNLTKGDRLLGSIGGKPGTLPATRDSIKIKIELFKGTTGLEKIDPLKQNEVMMISAATSTTIGTVVKAGENSEISLKKPICIDQGEKIAISRKITNRWCLIGFGVIE